MKRTPLKSKKGFKAIRRDPLDELFSEFVRKRAIQRVGGCEMCFHPKRDVVKDNGNILPAWKQLDCAHFDGRSNKAIRWDTDNAAGLCPSCHSAFDAHPFEKVEWIRHHLGEVGNNNLMARMRITYPKPDRNAIELYLRAKIKEVKG